MAVSDAAIAQLRKWTNEPDETNYTDEDLTTLLEKYRLMDERGVDPYWLNTSTDPPTKTASVGWIETLDIHAAAADIWSDKAAALAEVIDRPTQSPTGRVVEYRQRYDNYMKQERHHRARRKAKSTALIQSPSRNQYGNSWIGNLPELD